MIMNNYFRGHQCIILSQFVLISSHLAQGYDKPLQLFAEKHQLSNQYKQ